MSLWSKELLQMDELKGKLKKKKEKLFFRENEFLMRKNYNYYMMKYNASNRSRKTQGKMKESERNFFL